MIFTEKTEATTVYLTTSDGVEYRTNLKGSYWERLYGCSWEMVHSHEEELCNLAYDSFKTAEVWKLNDIRNKSKGFSNELV